MRRFRNKLVVSCQDRPDWTIEMALNGGAGGLRINGPDDTMLARRADKEVCIIGCYKICVPGCRVYITPTKQAAIDLADAGADWIAFDATDGSRPVPVKEMIEAIHEAGCMAVADVSTKEEGIVAWSAGADMIATTLAEMGVIGICFSLSRMGIKVMAEGGIRTPEQAKECVLAGAELVCVGSAITRPHVTTRWFVEELKKVQ